MKIERLQKRACKLILNYNDENVFEVMNNLKILTFSERMFLRKAKFMYKVSKDITPSYINELFLKCQPLVTDGNETHILRSVTADNFVLPKPSTELYKNSMAFSGPVIWNCLPDVAKNALTIQSFHSKCIQWMKS